VSRFLSLILLPLLAATPMAGVLPDSAYASLTVCNKTAHAAAVAVGFFNGKIWGSAGWWTVAAGGCESVIKEPLNGRYYYLYAAHEDVGGSWDGDRSFCVARGHFTIQGRNDCLNQGYEMRRFFQIDTGASSDWTENLAD
jgi:uncharacterized membrane protein